MDAIEKPESTSGRRKFKQRFLLDLIQKQNGTDIDLESDPISLLNSIIQSQEEDCFSSSDEEENKEDDDMELEGQESSGQDEYSYSDTYSVSEVPLSPPLRSRFKPFQTVPRRDRRILGGVPPLRSIKTPIIEDVVDSAESEVVEPRQPIRMFKCGKCVSVFSSQKSLTIHKLQRHMNNGGSLKNRNGTGTPVANGTGRKVVTVTNGRSTSLQDFMQQQQQVPDFYETDDLLMMAGMDPKDILKCTYCPRQFPNPSTLKVHMNMHTRERPYECSYCQKRFFQSSHLTVHIRTHTGEKPYQCQFCKNAFNSPSNCRVHERTHMKGNEIYQCEECNIGFLHKSRLERHLRSRKHVHPGGIVPRIS